MPLSLCTAMSHSSRAQPSCSHQSPEERHGPAVQRISPCISLFLEQVMCAGLPSCIVMATFTGGRKMRSAVTRSSPQRHRDTEEFVDLLLLISSVNLCLCGESPSPGVKRCM